MTPVRSVFAALFFLSTFMVTMSAVLLLQAPREGDRAGAWFWAAVGWFAGEGRDEAKRILGVPSGRLVRTALSLGYPDRDPPRGRSALTHGRKPMTEMLHEDLYGQRKDANGTA